MHSRITMHLRIHRVFLFKDTGERLWFHWRRRTASAKYRLTQNENPKIQLERALLSPQRWPAAAATAWVDRNWAADQVPGCCLVKEEVGHPCLSRGGPLGPTYLEGYRGGSRLVYCTSLYWAIYINSSDNLAAHNVSPFHKTLNQPWNTREPFPDT